MRKTLIIMVFCASACNHADSPSFTPVELRATPWDKITQQAKGSTVNFAMWGGEEARNRYFRSAVAETLLGQYGINLHVVPIADTADAINKMWNEQGAGKAHDGSLDLLGVNGENFRTAKQANLLWGAVCRCAAEYSPL